MWKRSLRWSLDQREVVAREEPYSPARRGRRVMLELTRDQAIALRDFLVEQVK